MEVSFQIGQDGRNVIISGRSHAGALFIVTPHTRVWSQTVENPTAQQIKVMDSEIGQSKHRVHMRDTKSVSGSRSGKQSAVWFERAASINGKVTHDLCR